MTVEESGALGSYREKGALNVGPSGHFSMLFNALHPSGCPPPILEFDEVDFGEVPPVPIL